MARTTYENRLVLVLGLGGAVAALDAQALFYLSPYVMRDMHLSNASIGLVSSIVVVTWAIAAYVVGALADRTGRRKQYLVASFALFAACSGLSGLATTFGMLLAARALIGLAEGPVIPISQSIMIAESSPHRRGLNMGIVQNLGAQLVGSMLGPLIVVGLAEAFDWRVAFYLAGVPGLAVAILVAVYVRNQEPVRETVATPPATAKTSVAGISLAAIRELLRFGNIRACLLISCFVVGWYFLMLVYLPLYLVNVIGMTPTRMSVVLGCSGAAGVLSAVIVPFISDRIGRKPVLVVCTLLGVLTPLGALLAGNSFGLLLCMVFVGGLLVGTVPLFMGTIPMETAPVRFAATASGLILGVGQILGGFTVPAVAGVLADRFGLATPMWIAVGMSLLATVSCLWLRETAPARVGAARPAAAAL